MLFGKSELEEKPLFWECRFCAVDLGVRLLQNRVLGLDVSVGLGNAIARCPGKGGKKSLTIRMF